MNIVEERTYILSVFILFSRTCHSPLALQVLVLEALLAFSACLVSESSLRRAPCEALPRVTGLVNRISVPCRLLAQDPRVEVLQQTSGP